MWYNDKMIDIPKEIHERVMDRIEECARASGVYIKRLKVDYGIKSHALIGEARYEWAPRLRFNSVYLMGQPDEFIYDVVAHEYAHLAAWRRRGLNIKPHGVEWQDMMLRMGVEPTREYDWALAEGWEAGPRGRMLSINS